MDRSVISSILEELNLNENSVMNIYNYGSWVYGTNSATSDRDIMIVARSLKQEPLRFQDNIEYFHQFELHKLWNKFDVCLHSVENFETLLKHNYLLAVECIFLPDEFKIKEKIDFRKIYLEKYFDEKRIKLVAFHENKTSQNMYDLEDTSVYYTRSSMSNDTSQANKDYLFKNLFHGFRFLDFATQLIETKSIRDFKSVSHVLNQMKTIRGDPTNDDATRQSVLDYVVCLSNEYKAKLNTLVPTNNVKGTFEAHITFDCTHHTENVIENLKKICENTKYKIIFIDLESKLKNHALTQLMTSSYYNGEYPTIVEQIKQEAYEHFKDFNIIRIKIESLASNEGVPETDAEKTLLWDNETNYFEFHYKVLIRKNSKEDNYRQLQELCRRQYLFQLHLSRNAFQNLDETNTHYMVTMRLFGVGRQAAFEKNEQVVEILTKNRFPPLKVVREFIVYDSYIDLDYNWK